jgi:acetyl esterase/lipase
MKTIEYFIFLFPLILLGQNYNQNYPPEIDSDTVFNYKTIDETKLNLWVFNPPKSFRSNEKPAIVFFFGGGFRMGSPKQFEEHSKYLSARGMVSIVVDYRVSSRNKTKPIKCLNDAKSAIRWVRKHSEGLGIDPNKIIASGGSAGGALAAMTGTVKMFDEKNEDLNISSKPNAIVLFNPGVLMSPVEEYPLSMMSERRKKNISAGKLYFGVDAKYVSPYNYIDNQTPPTIIFHGKNDTTVDPKTVVLFNQKMKKFGNNSKLYLYADKAHGFFNYGLEQNGPFVDTMRKVDDFLINLGYIEPLPSSVSM